MATSMMTAELPVQQMRRDWLDLVRACIWFKSYTFTTCTLAFQYLKDYRAGLSEPAPALEHMEETLAAWIKAYAHENPCDSDLHALLNWAPESNVERTRELWEKLSAWREQVIQLRRVLTDLSLRTFRNRAAIAHFSTALQQVESFLPQGHPPSLKRTFKNIGFLEIMLGETQLYAPPRWLILDQNNVCNFKCKMCLVHAEGTKFVPAYFTPLAHVQANIAWAEKITLGGTGEPLMHPHLGQLLQSKTPDTYVTINTNASLIPEHYDQLAQMDEIDISFDGDNAATFETLRQGGRFEKTLEAVRILRQAYPNKLLILNIVVSRLNITELMGMARWAVELGVTHLALNPIYIDGPLRFLRLRLCDRAGMFEQFKRMEAEFPGRINVISNITDADFLQDEEDHPVPKAELLERLQNAPPLEHSTLASWEELTRDIESLRDFTWWPLTQAEAPARIVPAVLPPVYDQPTAWALEKTLSKRLLNCERIQLPYCLAPWLITYVNANAMVKPCCFYEYHLGEAVTDRPLEEVWNSVEYQALRRAMLGQQELPVFCRACTAGMRTWALDRLVQFAANYGFTYRASDHTLHFGERLDLDITLPH